MLLLHESNGSRGHRAVRIMKLADDGCGRCRPLPIGTPAEALPHVPIEVPLRHISARPAGYNASSLTSFATGRNG